MMILRLMVFRSRSFRTTRLIATFRLVVEIPTFLTKRVCDLTSVVIEITPFDYLVFLLLEKVFR